MLHIIMAMRMANRHTSRKNEEEGGGTKGLPPTPHPVATYEDGTFFLHEKEPRRKIALDAPAKMEAPFRFIEKSRLPQTHTHTHVHIQ